MHSFLSTLILIVSFLLDGEVGNPPPQSLVNEENSVFHALYSDSNFFLSTIKQNEAEPIQERVTGITVPHHLLARDLTGEIFSLISKNEYETIVIISPDHFHKGETNISVTKRNFETPFGVLDTNEKLVSNFLSLPFVSESQLFRREHGVQSITPFIAYYFPDAEIIPIAIKITTPREELDALLFTIQDSIDIEKVLIIQSTDFSHYLTAEEATRKDQETLRILSSGNSDNLFQLQEPDHLDSIAGQYIQSELQQDFFHSHLSVVHNRNSQYYSDDSVQETTSYITQIYTREQSPTLEEYYTSYFIAGDTFFGRDIVKIFRDENRRKKFVDMVFSITHGHPLIVNLEGVMLEECPENIEPYKLCMEQELTLHMLQELHVIAVSIANNHANDFGEENSKTMKEVLENAGIMVMENARSTEFEHFCMLTLSDVQNEKEKQNAILTRETLDEIFASLQCSQEIIAFLHWGKEFSQFASQREKQITEDLQERGVKSVIGAHSHSASGLSCQMDSCTLFSLGNFIFDQQGESVSGAILEFQFFPQGTYFSRLHENIPQVLLLE